MPDLTRRVANAWSRLAPLPGGSWLFSRLLGRMVPYSGSIRPRVLVLEPGYARVAIQERRRLRNHLRSVHALALANLGELTSGLAMTLALPPGARGIPVRIEIDYLKKARGRIMAEGRASPPQAVFADLDATATAELTDEAGETVARMTVTWRLSPQAP
jgi:acyl-coenzyme A thioesterase PaaI-like protein